MGICAKIARGVLTTFLAAGCAGQQGVGTPPSSQSTPNVDQKQASVLASFNEQQLSALASLDENEISALAGKITIYETGEDNLTNSIRTAYILRDSLENTKTARSRTCGFDTSGMYVRVRTEPIRGTGQFAVRLPPNGLQRLLGLVRDKQEARNLTVRFKTTNPEQEFTKPLLTLHSQQSGRDVSRDVVDRGHVSPFFRISPDTSMSLTAEYTLAKDVTLKAVQASLRVARVAATAIAPGSGVLTTLTQNKVQQEARIFDAALGEIFSDRLAETRTTDFTANDWKYARAVRVRLYAWDDEAKEYIPVAHWDIEVSNPRPSMFALEAVTDEELTSQITDCATEADAAKRAQSVQDAHQKVTRRAFSYVRGAPDQVLRFYVGENTTVHDHIHGQDWYPALIEQLAVIDVRDDDGAITDAALKVSAPLSAFCARIPDALYRLGLNTYDATTGLWAMAQTTLASQNLLSLITDDAAPPACQTRAAVMRTLGLVDES